MKILFISHHIKWRSEPRIIDLARRVSQRGHKITLLCIKEVGRTGINEYDEDGIHYVEVPDLFTGNLRTGWDPWNAIHRWLYLRKHFDFDLVHAFETRPTTIHPLQLVLKRKRIPLVIDWIDWWGRGGLITTNRPKWYQVLFTKLETFYEEHYRTMADATTVICSGLAERAKDLGVPPDSIFKAPIGADTARIEFVEPSTYREENGFHPSDQIAVFAAVTGLMDAEMVFKAAQRVHQSNPRFKLVMTGFSAERFTKYAKDTGLEDCFTHMGMMPRDRFMKLLTCADLFLLPFADTPYNRGRWPCKIGDYLSAGRPIVSNPIGDVRVLMQKYPVGVLTEFEPDSFADGISSILSNPDQAKEMRQTARKVAETELNWDRIIDVVEEAYRFATTHNHQR